MRAVAERGRANDAVLRLLADVLGIPVAQLCLVTGPASRDKIVAVRGLEPGELRARLSAALAPGAGGG